MDPSELRLVFARRRRLWQASRARVTPVREVLAGARVRLVGRAVPIPTEAPLRTALTGRPAIFWEASVLRRRLSLLPASRRDGPSSTPWNLVFVDAAVTSFTLVDAAGGRIDVQVTAPDAVLARVPGEAVSEHPRVNRDDPQLAVYLRARGVTPGPHMGVSGALHFLEACIAPDERVTVYGHVQVVPRDADREPISYREADGQARALALVGTEDDPIVLARA